MNNQNTPTPGISIPTAQLKILVFVIQGSVYLMMGLILFVCLGTSTIFWNLHRSFLAFVEFYGLGLAAAGFLIYKILVLPTETLGFRITAGQFPELFQMINEVAVKIGIPFPTRVLLTDQNEVQIQLNRKWGSFGVSQFTLVIGLPLFCYLSQQEFKAHLTFGMSFMAGGKSADLVNVLKFNQTWSHVHEAFAHSLDPFRRPLMEVTNRLFPRLQNLLPTLKRQLETRADRWASQITTPEVAGRSLFRQATSLCRLRDKFWPALYEQTQRGAPTPENVYQSMHEFFLKPAQRSDVEYWYKECFENPQALTSSSRSIKDRISSIGFSVQELKMINDLKHPLAESERAFELLGPMMAKVFESFSGRWKNQNKKKWAPDPGPEVVLKQ